jgi:hypothetical protein
MERGLGTLDPCVEWEVPTSMLSMAEIALKWSGGLGIGTLV